MTASLPGCLNSNAKSRDPWPIERRIGASDLSNAIVLSKEISCRLGQENGVGVPASWRTTLAKSQGRRGRNRTLDSAVAGLLSTSTVQKFGLKQRLASATSNCIIRLGMLSHVNDQGRSAFRNMHDRMARRTAYLGATRVAMLHQRLTVCARTKLSACLVALVQSA